MENSSLDDFCLSEFLAYYTLSCKSKDDTSSECQPNILEDKLMIINHDDYPYPNNIKLTNSKTKTMRFCKVKIILGYYVSSKSFSPEKCAHHLLLLFYPHRDENDLLSSNQPLYQDKLQKSEAQDKVNVKKRWKRMKVHYESTF